MAPIMSMLMAVIFILLPSAYSQIICPKIRTVRCHLSQSTAMLQLFEQFADSYSDIRRKQFGLEVEFEFQRTRDEEAIDPRALFNVPALFQYASNNEFVFPIFSRALVMVFNIPGVKTLQMPIDLIAEIYKGHVIMWNDPVIRRFNPNVTLPSEKIVLLARQEEAETSTSLFTMMLSRMDEEWDKKFGSSFKGPLFENGTSKNWGDRVKFFPAQVVGMVGYIVSIPFSIGYATKPDIELFNVNKISLLADNDNATIVQASVEAIQIPMIDTVQNTTDSMLLDNATLVIRKDNMKAHGAYPMVGNTYIILKQNYKAEEIGNCCLIQEMIGFLESMLNPIRPEMFTKIHYVPIEQSMVSMITRLMLQRITCDGRNMYEEYKNIKPIAVNTGSRQLGAAELALIIISVLLSIAAAIAGSAYYVKTKRSKEANSNLYVIEALRLTVALPDQTHGYKTRQEDLISVSESKRTVANITTHRETMFLKNPYIHGDLDENTKVDLAEFPLACSQKPSHEGKLFTMGQWSDKTRALANKLRKLSGTHRNLAAFIGYVELSNGKTYTLFEHSTKGTLHYCLATSRYRLTDSIKRYLAVDVANGLEYLHTRVGVVHGQLNSLTCYLDMAWTVKIGLWDQTALHYSESLRYGGQGEKAFFSQGCHWRCKPEEVKTLIHSDIGSEALTRLLYLDPQLPTIYPQPTVDVYSFGMLLTEIFTGKLPYFDDMMINALILPATTVTPDPFSQQAHAYQGLLEKKFHDPTTIKLPSLPKTTPKYVQNIVEASFRAESAKRPTMKTILRHLTLSSNDKGGLVDAMMETMDTYAEQLEEKVEERTAELKQVTTRMRDLLNEVLPPQIAEKLFQGEAVPPEHFESVSVYFSDIVGFTIISAKSTPIQVMSFLNDLWLMFDSIIQDFDVYKVDTIGDAYMVCSGLPNRNGVEHSRQIARLSLALLESCKKFKIAHLPDEQLSIRIGLNSGAVTAGVVGLKMPQYCVFGDTVNTAARMESTSLPGRIQISSSTYMLLVDHFPGQFSYEYRGEITVKGKGNMLTYWLLSNDEIEKRQPTPMSTLRKQWNSHYK